jgi:hypothetical protein
MTGEMAPPKAGSARARKVACAAVFVAYFFAVSWDTVRAHFAPDEMFAIWWYWHPGTWHLLSSQFLLWKGYLRPLGGLFFLPIYLKFGLDPVPYHVVLLLLVLAGAYLMYRLARALGCGDLPAAVVALIACYHGGLSNLYYNSVFVFDVLVGIFYFAAFTYYARVRTSGKLLNGGQTAVFLALYLCALNSKEMAVTLPIVLLAYEWLFHTPPPWRPREFLRWILGPGRCICWAGLLNLLFIYGKRFGADGLMNGPSDAYKPVLSWERIVDFNERYLGDLFYHLPRFSGVATVAIWILVTWLAWRRNRPVMRFCWVWMMVTPIPIEFIVGRDQACLYVCQAGWAVMAGILFADLVDAAAPRLMALDAQCRSFGLARTRTLIAAAGMLIYAAGSWQFKESVVNPSMPALGALTTEVLAEFRVANPSVRPGSTVVFLDDPWHNAGFDMAFIAELWFRDRDTRVLLSQGSHVSHEELAKADAVFTWQEGKLIRVR